MLFVPKKADHAASHEDLFVERYDRLFVWSLQLTDNDRSLAKICFTTPSSFLRSINPTSAPLRTLMPICTRCCVTCICRRCVRATRSRFQQLSILDYDSAEVGLWAIDPVTRFTHRMSCAESVTTPARANRRRAGEHSYPAILSWLLSQRNRPDPAHQSQSCRPRPVDGPRRSEIEPQ